jgi:cytochrome c553
MSYWRLTTIIIAASICAAPTAAAPLDDATAFFETKIRPVLVEQCYACHGPQKQRAGLRLDNKEAILKGGESGPALIPGKIQESLLLRALRHQEPKMPPKGKLPETVIADFARWIEMGAPDPRDGTPTTVAKEIDWTEARKFWAFQPPRMPELPRVQNEAWVQTPLDRFILARLEAEKLRPVPPAGKRELLRRASFDLTGLPPSPEETEAFLKDTSADAVAKMVERLLASPHHGERWGRYWLDVARYAEDQAHTFGVKPNSSAWRYRDWVIKALNDDMPYDRFVRLQIAADQIEKEEPARLQHLPALGFFGLGAQYYKNTDAAKASADELDDRVDTLTRGFLGLTVSCARCHDHKFDPIPQVDYYSLAGIFQSCRLANLAVVPREQEERYNAHQERIKKIQGEVQTLVKTEKTRLAEARAHEVARYLLAAWKYDGQKSKAGELARKEGLEQAVLMRCVKYLEKSAPANSAADEAQARARAEAFAKQVQEALAERGKKPLDKAKRDLLQGLFGDKGIFTPTDDQATAKLSSDKKEQLKRMKTEVAKLQQDDAAKPLPVAHGLVDATPADMKIFLRGNPAKQGEVAPRRFLHVLASNSAAPFTQGSGRRELAEAIATKDNPLTARVIVNRVWQHHFGRPLVDTPSNLGKLGGRPTHPELLDYLACRLVESGWSLKALHREIMLSAVYQLSSERDEKNFAVDGDNRYLWRMNRRRLDIEAWRDAMLAVADKLDRTLGGPTLDLNAGGNVRRTIYAKISRHDLNQLLRLFDFPDANITSERRTETTVPQQQLFVLNSPFIVEMARALAARVQKEAGDEPMRLQRAFHLAYSRPATSAEVNAALGFLAGQDDPSEQTTNRLTRWERLAQVLLGSNEFMYID